MQPWYGISACGLVDVRRSNVDGSAFLLLYRKTQLASEVSSSPAHSPNSHEVSEHFQTKTPCYPACTDGLLTPNLLEKTKEDSNRKGKTQEKSTSPPPKRQPSHHPLRPAGRCGARALSVPLASLVCVVVLLLH